MNLYEWKYTKTNNLRESAKASLRRGEDLGLVMERHSALDDDQWTAIAEDMDAEAYIGDLHISEATDVSAPVQVSDRIVEYVDFVPDADGKSYWITFVAETAFINEHPGIIASVQESLSADDFEVTRIEDGMSLVLFKEAMGTPITRRTHNLRESPLTMAVIEPAPTAADIKRASVLERIYGDKNA